MISLDKAWQHFLATTKIKYENLESRSLVTLENQEVPHVQVMGSNKVLPSCFKDYFAQILSYFNIKSVSTA